MTKIAYCSDLHLEHGNLNVVLPDADVLILAGDILSVADLQDWNYHSEFPYDVLGTLDFLKKISMKYPKVLFCPGNHEYWGMEFNSLQDKMNKILTELGHTNIEFSPMGTYTINDVKIVWGTLWTDMNKNDPSVECRVHRGMNDYRYIEYTDSGFKRFLTPSDVFKEHSIHRSFIINECTSEDGPEKIVVFSHHGPIYRKFNDYLDFAYYCTDIEELIGYNTISPKVWIHGHSHARTEYMVEDTKILMNCRGYEDYEKEFASSFEIKVFEL
jgi:predicted MPP superfamily phosphohydrolase